MYCCYVPGLHPRPTSSSRARARQARFRESGLRPSWPDADTAGWSGEWATCGTRLCRRAPVAQWIEHLTSDQAVGGSSPSRRAKSNHAVWRPPRGGVACARGRLAPYLRPSVCDRDPGRPPQWPSLTPVLKQPSVQCSRSGQQVPFHDFHLGRPGGSASLPAPRSLHAGPAARQSPPAGNARAGRDSCRARSPACRARPRTGAPASWRRSARTAAAANGDVLSVTMHS